MACVMFLRKIRFLEMARVVFVRVLTFWKWRVFFADRWKRTRMERGLEVGKVERGWRVNVSGGLAHNTRFDFVGKMYVLSLIHI